MSERKYFTTMVKTINPKWLREQRKRKGMSLREMARKLGYSAAFISDVELGRRNPNEKILAFFDAA